MQNSTEVAANNNQKPKIAIFHYSGPPNTSGVDIIIRDQARFFRLHGYKVEIVAGLAKQFRKDIPVHLIRRISPKHPLVLSTLKELEEGMVSSDFKKLERSLFCSIKKYLIRNNIQVCILHNLFTRSYNLALTSALDRLIKDLPHIRFIAWVHDVVFYNEPDTLLKRELGNQYPWNLLVKPVPKVTYVCVSKFLKNDILTAFNSSKPAKITVIPNGRDIQKFLGLSPAMKTLYEDVHGLECDLIACLPVRAIPRKNLELALRIARAILNKGVKFKLLLTANIDYKREKNLNYYKYLEDLVQELKLKDHVLFLEDYFKRFATDKKPAPAISIPELFLISDFLLFTSRVEGFGLPLIEAGLMRCPIFAADIPPLREIGTTNINYFTRDEKPEQIADYILESLKKMPQAYFYRKVIKKFSLHTIFKRRILPLIESIENRESSANNTNLLCANRNT
ncbi:glycosyltransferase family 4 protein [Patescibacteria group bacterium]|nr:glycosyltransferase family 4 protein [Patescibacteria group bacterium]